MQKVIYYSIHQNCSSSTRAPDLHDCKNSVLQISIYHSSVVGILQAKYFEVEGGEFKLEADNQDGLDTPNSFIKLLGLMEGNIWYFCCCWSHQSRSWKYLSNRREHLILFYQFNCSFVSVPRQHQEMIQIIVSKWPVKLLSFVIMMNLANCLLLSRISHLWWFPGLIIMSARCCWMLQHKVLMVAVFTTANI